jgi:ATP-binding cassette, subfamily B, bacterial MsbA
MRVSLRQQRWLRKLAQRQFGALLTPLFSQQPAAQLIRQTAKDQWRLLAINFGSSLLSAFTEGATMAVIFLAVRSLAAPEANQFNWRTSPVVSSWPALVDWLSSLPSYTVFLCLLGLAVLLQALQSLTRFVNQVSVGYFAARCVAKVTAWIHHQVLSFSFPCASNYRVGDLTNHAATGPGAVRNQIECTGNLALGLLMTGTYLAVLVRLSPWLLVAAAFLAVLISALQSQLLPRVRAGSWRVSQREVAIISRVTEDFQGLRLLHTAGLLDQADHQLEQQMGGLEQVLRSRSRLLAVIGPVSSLLPIIAIAIISGLSLVLFQARSAGVLPNLVTFVLALQRLNQQLSLLAAIFTTLADNSGNMDRLNAILQPADKQFRRLTGTQFNILNYQIRFDNVSLRYAPDLPPALRNVSFTLNKGQMIALVGPSGAGKSSIADLLAGLYSPSSGSIVVDGIPLDDLNLSSWQQRLGVVSQDTFLFNATLAENIAFGRSDANIDDIRAAADAAQADGFIQALPDGYQTMVGERGYRLSGGQRQRISLARAILRDPELLILDEATSALDTQSERLVQEALERFEANHTVLVIAHRLSTIVAADQILVLDQGTVVERGNHSSLLELRGLYEKLWRQQLGVNIESFIEKGGSCV